MSRRATEQGWALDALMAASGYEVLHPEARHLMGELGYDPTDFNRVLSRVKAGAMFPKAAGEVGEEIERKAIWYGNQSLDHAARDLYLRAALLYGQAQYSFDPGDPRKDAFRAGVNRAVEQITRLTPTTIERLELPFEGKSLYGLLFLPATTEPAPLVILLGGMDMYKEEWIKTALDHYVARGYAVLAPDGPGQGETLGGDLRVSLDNFERAIGIFIDAVEDRPEIDAERIGLWGVSMGSYWGLRTGAVEPRLKAVGTAMGCYGDMRIIFERAQPSFKRNFMNMSGYTDEDAFDREVAAKMGVDALVEKIEVPVLMQYGEFDELSTVDATVDLYDKINAPKRLMIFEQEFHALGGVGAELIGGAASWLDLALAGRIPAGEARQSYLKHSGEVVEDATPDWWLSAAAAPEG
ncbi:MAG: alpha/beta hydrolase [Actinobacteria bacterium]|nr:alpha/beta hydrolase [Actinomycetota bacterium]